MRVVSLKTFGKRMTVAREARNLSQAELARQLNLKNQSNLSRWENGHAEPGVLQAATAALCLGLTPNELVLEGLLPSGKDAQLSVEEREILRLVREMQNMVHDVDVGPMEVVLNMVRNSHRMITECTSAQ
jgi:transcriptional regulator with XRE-family HTH domain